MTERSLGRSREVQETNKVLRVNIAEGIVCNWRYPICHSEARSAEESRCRGVPSLALRMTKEKPMRTGKRSTESEKSITDVKKARRVPAPERARRHEDRLFSAEEPPVSAGPAPR